MCLSAECPICASVTNCRLPMRILPMFGLWPTTCTGICWLRLRTSVWSSGEFCFKSLQTGNQQIYCCLVLAQLLLRSKEVKLALPEHENMKLFNFKDVSKPCYEEGPSVVECTYVREKLCDWVYNDGGNGPCIVHITPTLVLIWTGGQSEEQGMTLHPPHVTASSFGLF